MKFVGGPMHGCDVPDGLATHAHMFAYQDHDSGDIGQAMLIKVVVQLVGHEPTRYVLAEWFVGPGRALVPYLAWEKLTDENLVRYGREVFGTRMLLR